jgi:hypothetical protein
MGAFKRGLKRGVIKEIHGGGIRCYYYFFYMRGGRCAIGKDMLLFCASN